MTSFNARWTNAAAAAALCSIVIASPAISQPRSLGWNGGMMMGLGIMGPGMMGTGMCNPQAAGLAEWRMEALERAVQPTESQRSALNDLKTASARAADTIASACPKEFPETAPARLEVMERRLEAMLAAVKTVRPAFDAFYATLTDPQKAAVNQIGPRHWGWRWWQWQSRVQ